jgi:hypothetical protein
LLAREFAVDCAKFRAPLDPLVVVARGVCEADAGRWGIASRRGSTERSLTPSPWFAGRGRGEAAGVGVVRGEPEVPWAEKVGTRGPGKRGPSPRPSPRCAGRGGGKFGLPLASRLMPMGRWGVLSGPKSPRGEAVSVAEASAACARLSAGLAVSAFAVRIVAGAGDDVSLSTTMRSPPKAADVVITTPVFASGDSSERNPAKSPAARWTAAAVGCTAVCVPGAARALLPA